MNPPARDMWWSLALAAATMITRLPFQSQYLYHWDSVNFALSLEHYDVQLHQPHPPGYFLYSMLGRLVNLFMRDANASLVWISLLSGALGVVALYWLGARMFDRRVGVVAALMALASPLHWFYSEVALSYSLEFLLVTIVAGLCYLQLTGHRQVWLLSAIMLGIAGGVRQNDLTFLLPLWLICLIPLSWGQRAASLAALGVTVMAWALPMMTLSGGPAGYLAALGAESDGVFGESGLFSAQQLGLNGGRLALYVGYGLLLGALPLMWGAWQLARRARACLRDRRAWALALWIGPAVSFYLVVHIRQHGHIFTFLPALFLLAALAVTQLGQRSGAADRAMARSRALAAMLIAGNGLFFLLGPASLFGSEQLPLQTPSRQTIAQRDDSLAERITFIQTRFDPKATVVLAGGLDFRHPDFYLREFQDTSLSYELGDDRITLSDPIRTLVLFDDEVLPDLTDASGVTRVALSERTSIRYISWDSSQHVSLNRVSVKIERRAPHTP